MANEPQRIYWDSCVYIECIQQTKTCAELLRSIVRMAETGEIVFIASTMVIAEVVKLKDSSESIAKQASQIQKSFENPYIKVRAVDRKTSEDAAELARKFGIKPADAIHIATAIRWKCHCLQTYDGPMLACDGKAGSPKYEIKVPAGIQKQVQLLLPNQPSLASGDDPENGK